VRRVYLFHHPSHYLSAKGVGKSTKILRFAKIYIIYNRPRLVGAEPADFRVAAEPGKLPFGISARIALDKFHGLVVGDAAVEIVEELPVANRLQGIQTAVGVHRTRLGFEAVGKHLPDTAVDASVQLLARHV